MPQRCGDERDTAQGGEKRPLRVECELGQDQQDEREPCDEADRPFAGDQSDSERKSDAQGDERECAGHRPYEAVAAEQLGRRCKENEPGTDRELLPSSSSLVPGWRWEGDHHGEDERPGREEQHRSDRTPTVSESGPGEKRLGELAGTCAVDPELNALLLRDDGGDGVRRRTITVAEQAPRAVIAYGWIASAAATGIRRNGIAAMRNRGPGVQPPKGRKYAAL